MQETPTLTPFIDQFTDLHEPTPNQQVFPFRRAPSSMLKNVLTAVPSVQPPLLGPLSLSPASYDREVPHTTLTFHLPAVCPHFALNALPSQALEGGQMGIVRLHQALQQRLEAEGTESRTSGVAQRRLLQTNDLMEGLSGAGLTPLTVFDAKKVHEERLTILSTVKDVVVLE